MCKAFQVPDPPPGSFTICIPCGEWNTSDSADEDLRCPDDEEYDEIRADPQCSELRDTWVKMISKARAH